MSAGEAEYQETAAGVKGGKHGCFFYGCLTVIVVGALLVGAVVGFLSWGKGKIGVYCEEYLAAVQQGEYEAAYHLLGDRAQQDLSVEEYVAFAKTVHRALGGIQGKRLVSINVSSSMRGTTAVLVYRASCENAKCNITFSLEKTGDKWVVQSVHYDSPVLQQVFKCPHCGAVLKDLGKFCAQCGKPLRPADNSDE